MKKFVTKFCIEPHACLLKQIALRFFDKVYEGEIEVYSNITESPLPNNFMVGRSMSYGSNTRMQTKTKRFLKNNSEFRL